MLPVEQYEKLLPIAEKLYTHMDQVAQTLLLPVFLFSILFAYNQDIGLGGAVISRIKRLVIVALLLAAFPTLSTFIRDVGQEIALSIDNLGGLDEMIRAASIKARTYSLSVRSLGDLGQGLMTGAIVSVSFFLLFFARFGLVAFYHFYWLVLLVTAPLMILCYLFETTAGITKNLFKNLILVAAWPIIWAILSAFLKGLPFNNFYGNPDTAYATVAVMNLILVASLLLSPFLLTQFCEGMIVGTGSVIHTAARTVLTKGLSQLAPAVAPLQKFISNKAPRLRRSQRGSHSMPLAVLLLTASATAFAQSEPTIQMQPGLSTLLCLQKMPHQAALGDPTYFKVDQMGRNLVLRAIAEDKATNLIVYLGENLFETYALKSSKILPHTTRVGCEAQDAAATRPKAPPAKAPVLAKLKTPDGIALELTRARWNGDARDHLTLELRILNRSENFLNPSWNRLQLVQGSRHMAHSKLWSSRRVIEPGASIQASVQFTRVSLQGGQGAVIRVPRSKGADLELSLPEAVLR